MPQFDPHFFVPQVAWLILVFGLLFAVVQASLPKVTAVTGGRARVIGDDLGGAEAAKARAASVVADYEATLAKARTDAAAMAADAKTAASAETAARLKAIDADLAAKAVTAEAQIDAARVAALGELRPVAEAATSDIVERLTGRRPDADAVARGVAAAGAAGAA